MYVIINFQSTFAYIPKIFINKKNKEIYNITEIALKFYSSGITLHYWKILIFLFQVFFSVRNCEITLLKDIIQKYIQWKKNDIRLNAIKWNWIFTGNEVKKYNPITFSVFIFFIIFIWYFLKKFEKQICILKHFVEFM